MPRNCFRRGSEGGFKGIVAAAIEMAREERRHYRIGWMNYITQAGVALGFAMEWNDGEGGRRPGWPTAGSGPSGWRA